MRARAGDPACTHAPHAMHALRAADSGDRAAPCAMCMVTLACGTHPRSTRMVLLMRMAPELATNQPPAVTATAKRPRISCCSASAAPPPAPLAPPACCCFVCRGSARPLGPALAVCAPFVCGPAPRGRSDAAASPAVGAPPASESAKRPEDMMECCSGGLRLVTSGLQTSLRGIVSSGSRSGATRTGMCLVRRLMCPCQWFITSYDGPTRCADAQHQGN